jgi:hypothetical protein
MLYGIIYEDEEGKHPDDNIISGDKDVKVICPE